MWLHGSHGRILHQKDDRKWHEPGAIQTSADGLFKENSFKIKVFIGRMNFDKN